MSIKLFTSRIFHDYKPNSRVVQHLIQIFGGEKQGAIICSLDRKVSISLQKMRLHKILKGSKRQLNFATRRPSWSENLEPRVDMYGNEFKGAVPRDSIWPPCDKSVFHHGKLHKVHLRTFLEVTPRRQLNLSKLEYQQLFVEQKKLNIARMLKTS